MTSALWKCSQVNGKLAALLLQAWGGNTGMWDFCLGGKENITLFESELFPVLCLIHLIFWQCFEHLIYA